MIGATKTQKEIGGEDPYFSFGLFSLSPYGGLHICREVV